MLRFFAKKFIQDYDNPEDQNVRLAYGTLSGILGIGLNIFLFLIKLLAGLLSSSISILADAFNNLSDAGSSIVTIIGFRIAGQKPDEEHPFGHGRFEYISGLVVAMLIIIMAVELIQSSISKILHPEPVEVSGIIIGILIISIAVKLYMFHYNRYLARLTDSSVLAATATDSISDVISTSAVLLASLVSFYTGILLDGVCGVLVGAFILWQGMVTFRETVSPLLGEPPSKEFVDEVEQFVCAYDGILGVHDVIVHNYGPMNLMMSLHVEVPAQGTLMDAHDRIDQIEQDLKERYHCNCVIHMDPVSVEDPYTSQLRDYIGTELHKLDPKLQFHDFRIIHHHAGQEKRVAFDLVVPYKYTMSDEELTLLLSEKIKSLSEHLVPEITIDHE